MRRLRYFLGIALLGLSCVVSWAENNSPFTRTEDVVYGRKFGTALTLDVFKPANPNGAGIICLVSGGWYSSHEGINPGVYQPFLDRGYTVFAVVHGSQPKFIVSEICPDIHRAVRFIRHNAAQYGLNPQKLGITGGSAGGHLSLTIGTQGRAGDPQAKDPIDRESSEVEAVACFFPPTDFLNYGEPGVDAVGVGILKDFKAAFGPRSDNAEERQKLGREISPIYFVTSNLPPTLIIHGDADKLVPIQQSESFVKQANLVGAQAKLIIKPGKVHGWDLTPDLQVLADWFDEHLRGTKPTVVPRFSIDNMDPSVNPTVDFYHYAAGGWLKNNPVPADKARWGGISELQQRTWQMIRDILEKSAASQSGPSSALENKVGGFFASVMDTNRIEELAFKPLQPAFDRLAAVQSTEGLLQLIAQFQQEGVNALFSAEVSPDEKNSAIYSFYLSQGGLGMPDRDYYLTDAFASQRQAYLSHIGRMLELVGEAPADAKTHAQTVLELETALAKGSKSRTDLRDPIANYHKFAVGELPQKYASLPLRAFLEINGVASINDLVIQQPEFFAVLDGLVKERPLDDWKTYLRWHVLSSSAPYLHSAAEKEHFAFYGTVLSGQQAQEPRWQRAAKMIDGHIGEALGELFVAKYFPPTARARMKELVENLKAVFRDRLKSLDWMTDTTRAKALAKFDGFTQKIGFPEKFRDYSSVEIRRDDLLGNIRRSAVFESKRRLARVGQPVDKSEWEMTPQTVNAYFNPLQNEIVFPAGILQPPFFDMALDDAVNYGSIGAVIGHEITHGYDDEGRKYDASGNLNEWWTEADAKDFDARVQKLVDQYNDYEVLPGLKVNGKLTLGENIADLGGASIAYEALQRALAKDPSKRVNIDGFTPEQRYFLSWAQMWRTNCRESEQHRLITVDPHSPGQIRAIGPLVNLPFFYDAFHIKEGAPMWRPPELRAKVW